MNKLLDLLNEREEKEKTSRIKWKKENNPVGIYGYVGEYGLGFASKMIIISKEYGFIRRLVNNDKIDLDKVKKNCIKHNGRMDVDGLYRYSVYERVLMLLSIQDEPIEFLTEILKTEKQYTEEEQELIDLDYGTGYTKKFMK